MKKLSLALVLIVSQGLFAATLRDIAEGMAPGTWAQVPTTGFTWENVHKSCGHTGGCGNIFAYTDAKIVQVHFSLPNVFNREENF